MFDKERSAASSSRVFERSRTRFLSAPQDWLNDILKLGLGPSHHCEILYVVYQILSQSQILAVINEEMRL